MHVLINGSFWTQPTVGSGQYVHGLVRWLPRIAPHHRYTLLIPAASLQGRDALPSPDISQLVLRTPFDRYSTNLAKLWFEQLSVPETARLAHRNNRDQTSVLIHVPYFAPPLQSVVPLVTTIPDVIPLVLPEYRGNSRVRLYMSLVRHTAREVDHVITFSHYSCNDIVTMIGISHQRVSATLLAADERYLPPADRGAALASVAARYNLHEPFLYYVGGLDVRKNLAVLLRAVALLHQRGRFPAVLAIAGRALGGDQRLFPDIDGLIAHLDLGAVVRRIEVPHSDGPLLYQTCTAFAFPSRYEGFGLPPLEAMACGAPVVASTASSLPEVVGDAALLVDPDDPGAWAAALERMLFEPTLRTDLRTRGLAHAATFSWERVARETVQIYEQVNAARISAGAPGGWRKS
ncbi:MAG: glycosyltransferase family 4 protein [Chloroflexaceae bacterium]|nr:glycosyltransferase family 4 protein [Chloroflexaceae bacterium]